MIETGHTSELGVEKLAAARALLADVFDDLADSDWEHALGGIHALAWADGALVGHASVIQRRLVYEGRALRTGYVEAVVVRADARRRGHAGAMMAVLEGVIASAYDLGALGASEEGEAFYLARGWRAWEGPLSALTPNGIVPTPDEEGAVYVLADGFDFTRPLTCDWRDGDVW